MTLKIAKPNRQILISHKNTDSINKLKIAIAISKKVSKKAVERNRIRRILQENLLKNFSNHNSHKPYWLLVNLNSGYSSNYQNELLKEFHNLIFKSGLFR